MSKNHIIQGFSKRSRAEKIRLLEEATHTQGQLSATFDSFRHPDTELQKTFDGFSENTVSNYHLPYSIAPNFLVDGTIYHIPMVVEESSVVAAAAKSAKFWADKGGFQTIELQIVKKGQVHFSWPGKPEELSGLFEQFRPELLQALKPLTTRMEQRGGGITDVQLKHKTNMLEAYYQLDFDFKTADSMGANFINSVLEKAAALWQDFVTSQNRPAPEIIMAILSNYTPQSRIRMQVRCPLEQLNAIEPNTNGADFARKFKLAVDIARNEPYRAVTHNKGIMNGVDAVILATGNDFRAGEADVHAYAASGEHYTSLTSCTLTPDEFIYELNIPLNIGTVGGLTRLHPLAAKSLEIMGNPDARTLMKIAAAAGLANNFGAVRALVTSGIQKGHMKLHLDNIIHALGASPKESKHIKNHFAGKTVSYADIKMYLNELRSK